MAQTPFTLRSIRAGGSCTPNGLTQPQLNTPSIAATPNPRRSARINKIVNTPVPVSNLRRNLYKEPVYSTARVVSPVPTSRSEKRPYPASDDETSDEGGRKSYSTIQYRYDRAPRTPKKRKVVTATRQESPEHSTHSTSKIWQFFKTSPVDNTNHRKDERGRFPKVRTSHYIPFSEWVHRFEDFASKSKI